ncbi:hypothetical protein [Brachyspira hampsonii]|uniref:Uncharacterized protein n=1 Tax=Brachyspira hampsonii 30446 TaxID=1289135 RepID=A0A2U4EVP7_9SPIR|nr:hypothetical protein [Brachyspira hampsonii]EKV56925.1 hypothetical protein A966_07799 [Brachyspira hampsonii 30446]MBW5390336.1 hypothetical protein [Brachyspira hampsonii]MBW5395277.1 hypothetical protein [Brachyspira hampsonii]OEJ18267.1 hypothetical protein A9495_06085 [Brachyspira hampsonii]PTY40904.1 hypothetical protein DQ06_10260 [Brachyspira hampsonii bv. II]
MKKAVILFILISTVLFPQSNSISKKSVDFNYDNIINKIHVFNNYIVMHFDLCEYCKEVNGTISINFIDKIGLNLYNYMFCCNAN